MQISPGKPLGMVRGGFCSELPRPNGQEETERCGEQRAGMFRQTGWRGLGILQEPKEASVFGA